MKRVLKQACLNGDLELVRDFPKELAPQGFIWACEGGHSQIIDWYLGNTSVIPGSGLFGACKRNDQKLIESLWAFQGEKFVNQCLFGACLGGHLKLAQEMVQRGAEELNTALYWTYLGGHEEIGDWLFEQGADDKKMATYGAAQGNNLKLLPFKIKQPNQVLFGACKSGNILLSQRACQMGATKFDQAFGEACRSGSLEMVKWIVCDDEFDWNEGLKVACKEEHREICQYLIKKGATECKYCERPLIDH